MKLHSKKNSTLRMWSFHIREFVKVKTLFSTATATCQPILTNCSTKTFLICFPREKIKRERKIPVAVFLVCKKQQFFILNKNKKYCPCVKVLLRWVVTFCFFSSQKPKRCGIYNSKKKTYLQSPIKKNRQTGVIFKTQNNI